MEGNGQLETPAALTRVPTESKFERVPDVCTF